MATQKYILIILSVIILSAIFSSANAKEEFAEATGAECKQCHIDPLGGGELTQVGEGYYLSISPTVEEMGSKQGSLSKVLRLITGYLHILTALMWFGTILYVHLVLKPAYASRGLPKGEVTVGLVSMAIMVVTGAILTYYKVPSLNLLLSSQFGILLLIKIILFFIMVLSALFVVLVVGPKLKKKKEINLSQPHRLTLAELSGFNGEDGHPAYIAYKNKIYDVSRSQLWKNGNHMKRHYAGTDLTDMLPQAPHGVEKILAMQEVGQLAHGKDNPPGETHKKVFYFMAYMNLGFVFLITLILALWRWQP